MLEVDVGVEGMPEPPEVRGIECKVCWGTYLYKRHRVNDGKAQPSCCTDREEFGVE